MKKLSLDNDVVGRHLHAALNKLGNYASPESFLHECKALEEIDKEIEFIFDGLVFVYPFICLCCGLQINSRQWGFGRTCGRCDCGHCKCIPYYARSRAEQDKIRPHIKRFIDSEIIQINISDMMNLRRKRI